MKYTITDRNLPIELMFWKLAICASMLLRDDFSILWYIFWGATAVVTVLLDFPKMFATQIDILAGEETKK